MYLFNSTGIFVEWFCEGIPSTTDGYSYTLTLYFEDIHKDFHVCNGMNTPIN
jgi:hypothetical protein